MTKRRGLILARLLLPVFLLSWGSPDGRALEGEALPSYSNLVDQASRDEVRQVMELGGIPEENTTFFFKQVDFFNEAVRGYGLVQEGFAAPDASGPGYDPFEMQDLWSLENPDFPGYNCRITSFALMKGLVTVEYPQSTASDYLVFDELALDSGPESPFDAAGRNDFRTLFQAIPAEDTAEISVHIEEVAKHHENAGIRFPDGGVSLVCVYFHDEEGFLFVGHVGVLVEAGELPALS